ncbi:MAG: response regulator transcription factor [Acidimicrobiia bacterium]|nr:response regulator transcription factor [Acidimicrobiia bacterium]RZV42869.1 MAG: response regulator transcription factor [Acidimicrobiia bacterium]
MLAVIGARTELTEALGAIGITAVPLADATEVVDRQPEAGWDALAIDLGVDPGRGTAIARRVEEALGLPILAIADLASDVTDVPEIDDFLLAPINPDELRIRLRRLTSPTGTTDETIRFKDLELNLATYQASAGGAPLDLTFMEYELLRFFVTHPTRAWSRAQILSQVWGYDYFGGSRTVDVHVRRLRAKLGEERSSWIATVRSVGYRFG